MRLNNGFFAALICGAIWGFIWMVVISVLFMLISGEITRPPVGSRDSSGNARRRILFVVFVQTIGTGSGTPCREYSSSLY